jgi:hypothetical protein
MQEDRKPFRLFDPLQQETRSEPEDALSSEMMMRIICVLMLVCGIIAWYEQSRQVAKLEIEHLSQTITEQKQLIDSTPSPEQIAEEVIKKINEGKTAQPVGQGKPVAEPKKTEPQKPTTAKAGKPGRISQSNRILSDGYGLRSN